MNLLKATEIEDKIRSAAEPLLKFNLREVLNPPEVYTLGMLAIYSLFALLLYALMSNTLDLIFTNALIAMVIISISTIHSKFKAGAIFRLFRQVYLVPVIFIVYTQVQNYIRITNPILHDDTLIKWDFAIFGANPTEVLHMISTPILTELLQFAYIMYFFMPLIHGFEISLTKNDKRYWEFFSIILFAFYLSYLLYFFMPAVGPRFTLHDYNTLNSDLPGLFLTNYFRGMIDSNATIIHGAPITIFTINRDCMPSGHTLITLLNILLAFKYKSRFRFFFLTVGSMLIFSTVYLRYHYVVDVFAGIFLTFIVLWLEPKVRKKAEWKLE